VAELLNKAALLALPEWMRLANLLVAIEDDGSIVGAIGLEVHARRGLVRSVVVAEEQRASGVGSELMHGLIARANELGLRELFLLTETAAAFFVGFGFQEVERSKVPEEIRRTSSFANECPDGAAVLCLELETRI
jgi:amino-acid N-acetyltransferase